MKDIFKELTVAIKNILEVCMLNTDRALGQVTVKTCAPAEKYATEAKYHNPMARI